MIVSMSSRVARLFETYPDQLDLVEDLCESVAIIDRGALVVSGTVDELATRGGAAARGSGGGGPPGRPGSRDPRCHGLGDGRR
jgi:hypothetical protein